MTLAISVTRFGEISPLLAKCQKSLANFRVNLIFGIVLNLLWINFRGTKQIFIAENGKILKNNLDIWSHW